MTQLEFEKQLTTKHPKIYKKKWSGFTDVWFYYDKPLEEVDNKTPSIGRYINETIYHFGTH